MKFTIKSTTFSETHLFISTSKMKEGMMVLYIKVKEAASK